MKFCGVLLVAATWCGAGALAAGADYPARSIRYIVPQGAGGSSDTLARLVTQKLSENLGQQVVTDNRPGATGNIGTEIAARANPDGYTLLQVATSHATNPALAVKMPFDPVRDFAPITLLSQSPNLWIVHPSLPAKNMRELIALARSRPGEINYSSSGTGSSQHLAGELLKSLARIDIIHIPYKGSPPALIDLLGGRVVLMCSTIAPAMPLVKSHKLRALAVTSLKRSAAAPEIPTVAESGLPGYEATAWQGVLAPAGTPREIIVKLNTGIVRVINLPDVRKQLVDQGYEPAGNTPEQFADYIKTEIAKWTRVINAAGLKAE